VKIFGIDPGSERTGYGCVESDGSRHRIVLCGAISTPRLTSFPEKLMQIHGRLEALLLECRPDCVAIENLFFATNVRSALKLGHARGVAMLAAVEAGIPVFEYTPAEVKRAVVGYGARRRRRARRGALSRPLAADRALRRHPPPGAHQGDQLAPVQTWTLNGPSSIPGRVLRPKAKDQGPLIAHLRGRILEKQPNRTVVDVGGVGYDVFVPLSTFYGLGDPGSEIALRIHTHVREDALILYGFVTLLEQELFERLIGVSGIGPKLALAVLSGIEPRDLIRAIERGDVARLTAIPGVGKKTAERIVLELKDRLPRAPIVAAAAGDVAPFSSELRDDLLSALINLGYHRPLAEKAVASALKAVPDGGFEPTLKQALRDLAK
jgi:Holliday junction DNA helicase RuvA